MPFMPRIRRVLLFFISQKLKINEADNKRLDADRRKRIFILLSGGPTI